MKSTRTRTCLALLAAMMLALSAVAPAQATFHLNRIREVHAGVGATGDYVELQSFAAGQNFVAGQHITTYDNGGGVFSDVTIPTNAVNGANQQTILIGDSASVNGVTPDFVLAGLNLVTGGGAVCYGSLDCVGYGTIGSFSTPSPYGSPVLFGGSGLTPGQTLVRSISRGCSTLFEGSDDTDSSAGDFALGTANPRNNTSPITEKACSKSGTGTAGAPNTKIKKRPQNNSGDTSPTYKFKSTETGSTFKCKLDAKKFHKCTSPKTYRGLDPGKHKFKVEAIDASGNIDSTPAKDKFKVLP